MTRAILLAQPAEIKTFREQDLMKKIHTERATNLIIIQSKNLESTRVAFSNRDHR